MREKSLHDVRQELLALPGIGAETADAILTYAFRMPSFVLDAYTRRFLERLWGAMVDYVTVGVDKRLTFVFRDGTEVEHKETVSLTY